MKAYRCKHRVEAMRWTDTDEDREKFSEWFEKHGAMFETNGPIAMLPDLITREDGDHNRVQPGEWVVWMDDAFTAMKDAEFLDQYEEATA